MPPITSICFVTGNKNKLAEVEAILGNSTADDGTGPGGGTGTGLRVTNRALDLVEIQGSSLEEISRDKCRRAAEAVCPFYFVFFYSFPVLKKGGGEEREGGRGGSSPPSRALRKIYEILPIMRQLKEAANEKKNR